MAELGQKKGSFAIKILSVIVQFEASTKRLQAPRQHCVLRQTPTCMNARWQNTLTRGRTHLRGHLDKMRVCRVTITHGLNLLLPRGRQHYQLRVKDKGRMGVAGWWGWGRRKKKEGDVVQCNNGKWWKNTFEDEGASLEANTDKGFQKYKEIFKKEKMSCDQMLRL